MGRYEKKQAGMVRQQKKILSDNFGIQTERRIGFGQNICLYCFFGEKLVKYAQRKMGRIRGPKMHREEPEKGDSDKTRRSRIVQEKKHAQRCQRVIRDI